MKGLTARAITASALLALASAVAAESVLSHDGVQTMRLSPDGAHIAVHSRSDAGDAVTIHAADTLRVAAAYETSAPSRVGSIEWRGDTEVLVSLAADTRYEPTPPGTGAAMVLGVSGARRDVPDIPATTPRLSAVLVDDSRYDDLLADLDAGPQQSAIAVVDASADGSRLIVRTEFGNRQDEFSVVTVATGAARRVLRKGGGLFFAGGTAEESYDQVAFSTPGRDPVSGFAAVRRGTGDRDYPVLVLLQRDPSAHAWDGSFDDEVDFFSRQRITVLTLNALAADPAVALRQVRAAIDWAAAAGHAQDNRVCLVGRGAGGTLALLTAFRLKGVLCAVSIGGEEGNPEALAALAASGDVSNRGVAALMISGADETDGYLAGYRRFADALGDRRVRVETLLVDGEKRHFARRQSEVSALAATALLVDDLFGKYRVLSVLPMTLDQSRQLQEIFDEFNQLARSGPTNDAIAWLDRRDSDVRAFLSAVQWDAYEAMIAQLGIKDRRSVGVPRPVPVSN